MFGGMVVIIHDGQSREKAFNDCEVLFGRSGFFSAIDQLHNGHCAGAQLVLVQDEGIANLRGLIPNCVDADIGVEHVLVHQNPSRDCSAG